MDCSVWALLLHLGGLFFDDEGSSREKIQLIQFVCSHTREIFFMWFSMPRRPWYYVCVKKSEKCWRILGIYAMLATLLFSFFKATKEPQWYHFECSTLIWALQLVERLWENSCTVKGGLVLVRPLPKYVNLFTSLSMIHLTFYWLSVFTREVKLLAIMFVTLRFEKLSTCCVKAPEQNLVKGAILDLALVNAHSFKKEKIREKKFMIHSK